ncbi:MAG TPA: ankyrin repeat domain-containing protein [Thermoanaerobaculia bacterium]|nr:ankyrin repeat domain-containing protein [Thermoanaerobaculia bacterium]
MKRLFLVIALIGCTSQPSDSPLTLSVREGDVAEVRAQLARGADPNAPGGGNGWTPLLHAVHKNQLGTAAALLDAGAGVDRPGASGITPLMMAAGYDNKEMTALLLARGANPRMTEGDGSTALDFAIAGVPDIDRFTYFRCNQSTAAMLAKVSPPPRAATMRWARIKGCV